MLLSISILIGIAAVARGQAQGYAQCMSFSPSLQLQDWKLMTDENDQVEVRAGAVLQPAYLALFVQFLDYSQCIPGTAPPVGTGTTTAGIPASTTFPGTTLQSGYYWIRAVAAPNFHKYLQTNPQYKPGTALLESYTTAGQFQVQSGQLVELIDGGKLYANVIPSSATDKLAVTFNATQNTYGTFAWSGDALQWSISSITRPNLSAWLVCAKQELFVNLGNYGYMTPAGCSDQTIHYYNDSKANSKRGKRGNTESNTEKK